MPAVFFFVASVFNKAQSDSLSMRLGHTHQGEHKIGKHLSLATPFTKDFLTYMVAKKEATAVLCVIIILAHARSCVNFYRIRMYLYY